MNFAPSEWFGFNKRARHDMTFTKTINGETSTKQVYGHFNVWALLFTWFYALFSVRCRTPFFLLKTAVPFLGMLSLNMVTQLFFSDQVVMSIGLLGDIWYGFMFETWFRNQLVSNGYQQTA